MVGWGASEPNAYGDYVRPMSFSKLATVVEVGNQGFHLLRAKVNHVIHLNFM